MRSGLLTGYSRNFDVKNKLQSGFEVDPAMDWWPVKGVPLLLLEESWDRLQQILVTLDRTKQVWIMDEWMDLKCCCVNNGVLLGQQAWSLPWSLLLWSYLLCSFSRSTVATVSCVVMCVLQTWDILCQETLNIYFTSKSKPNRNLNI